MTLNYKSREKYQTTIGALMSILIRAVVFWFLATRIIRLFVHDKL
jgi:hypothetical protein